jgi:hypothetical protein
MTVPAPTDLDLLIRSAADALGINVGSAGSADSVYSVLRGDLEYRIQDLVNVGRANIVFLGDISN